MRRTHLRARAAVGVAAGALCLLLACGEGADQLLDTARLEEVQKNPQHARQLYEEVVRRWPDSPQARTAQERLRALASPTPPADGSP